MVRLPIEVPRLQPPRNLLANSEPARVCRCQQLPFRSFNLHAQAALLERPSFAQNGIFADRLLQAIPRVSYTWIT
jgi:hypothetical protein